MYFAGADNTEVFKCSYERDMCEDKGIHHMNGWTRNEQNSTLAAFSGTHYAFLTDSLSTLLVFSFFFHVNDDNDIYYIDDVDEEDDDVDATVANDYEFTTT